MSIGQAVLGYLYAGLTSVATGGPLFDSVIVLEFWMGMHIQFRAMDNLATECKTMLNHPLAFVGGPLHMSTKVWCKTAQLKGMKAWRDYFRKISVAEFNMRPRFLHNRAIRLPQHTRLALRLLGNEALVLYNPDRCYLQCGGDRTVVPILSHYLPIQKRKMDDEQDERDVRRALVHWEGCTRSVVQAKVEEDEDRAKEQINNWEHRGKAVKSDATTDDAYLQAYALKYGGKVYKSTRHQVDVAGEVATLRALLYSAVQDREATQRQTAELRREFERVRSTGVGGASSSRAAGGSPSLLEAQLARAVLRAEEAQRHLEERERDLQLTTEHAMDLQGQRDQVQGQRDQLQGQRDELQREIETTRGERDQLRIRAEAAEAQVAEATKELVALRV
ncbi:hypothetical protein Taro_056365 [Colocasia esculenta]|uniref:Uncharacterized protein n=1 Tax=Colocasia esculenta TaxID=4460 RepID=A0A843XWA1_COLES|nr:hypothetical protein [Colocasia esculenta]